MEETAAAAAEPVRGPKIRWGGRVLRRLAQRESYRAPNSGAKLQGGGHTSLHEPHAVAIVDPDCFLRRSLSALLQEAGLKVAGYDSAESFLQTADHSDCIVSEVDLPGASGLDLQAALARRLIRSPLLFIVGRLEPLRVIEAMKAGAFDVLMKPIDPVFFVRCVERALAQSARVGDAKIRQAAMRTRLAELTPRESEVLNLAIVGWPNKEIARHLGISHRTVEVHRRQILRKTEASSLLEIAGLMGTGTMGSDERVTSQRHSSTSGDKPPH